MKVFYSFLALLLFVNIACAATSDTIVVPKGSSITMDGYLDLNEWSDANVVTIPTIGLTVYFKHDGTDLLIAFEDVNGYGYSMSTGIYIDNDLDGGTVPSTDDMWIHGSAAAFEFVGNDSIWVQTSQDQWDYTAVQSNEYVISLAKFEIDHNATNYKGVLFSFLDWSVGGYEITWPAGGVAHVTVPDEWAVMQIEPYTVGLNAAQEPESKIQVSPNPSNGIFKVYTSGDQQAEIKVYNLSGELVFQDVSNKVESLLNLSNLSAGMYLLTVEDDIQTHHQIIIIQ